MTNDVSLGDTFLIPSGPSGSHLFVVCTEEMANGDRLLVSISSIRTGRFSDPTCVIVAGEHPFIKHHSYVAYGKVEQRDTAHILRCVECGVFIPRQPCSPELLRRIILGFRSSDFTRPWVLEILDSLGL